jgi:DNA-binding HxlR family transcriptional regulator
MVPKNSRLLTNPRVLNLLSLLVAGPMRPGKLARELGIEYRQMLQQYVDKLERDGLIKRTIVSERPPVSQYSLTPLGQSLADAARSVIDWIERNGELVTAQRTASLAARQIEKLKAAGECDAADR